MLRMRGAAGINSRSPPPLSLFEPVLPSALLETVHCTKRRVQRRGTLAKAVITVGDPHDAFNLDLHALVKQHHAFAPCLPGNDVLAPWEA